MPGVLDGVPWPKSFLQFALPLRIANLDFLAILSSAGCRLNVRFYDQFLLSMIMPVGTFVVVVMAYFCVKLCCMRGKKEKLEQLQTTASKSVILLILLLYPGISTKVFTMFRCKSIDGIDGPLLVEDYHQRCYTGEHATWMTLGIIFLCVYVLGIPLVMGLLLRWNRAHLHDTSSDKHALVSGSLGGMYDQYEPMYWWFEIFLLLNKTIMCGGLVMVSPGTSLQVLIATLIMLSHMLFVLKLAPVRGFVFF